MDKQPDPLGEVERRLGEARHYRLDNASPEVIAEHRAMMDWLATASRNRITEAELSRPCVTSSAYPSQ